MDDYLKFLPEVAQGDVKVLQEKEQTYRGSWKKRGGVGAFMMLARKWDRMENIVAADANYDLFEAAQDGDWDNDDHIMGQVRDLRRYLMLVEAELLHRAGQQPLPVDTETEQMNVFMRRPAEPISSEMIKEAMENNPIPDYDAGLTKVGEAVAIAGKLLSNHPSPYGYDGLVDQGILDDMGRLQRVISPEDYDKLQGHALTHGPFSGLPTQNLYKKDHVNNTRVMYEQYEDHYGQETP